MGEMDDQAHTFPARLGINKVNGMASLSLSGPSLLVEELPLPNANDWGAVEGLATMTSAYLSIVRESCASLTLSTKERDLALETLRAMGTKLMGRILGKYRAGWHKGLGPGTLRYGPNFPPLMDVEISCNDQIVLPAEILPLADPIGSEPQAELRNAAALLGFGAACHRATTATRAEADEALLDPQAVRFYWHVGLRGAKEQWKWLCKRFEALGPHPEKDEDSRALAELIVLKRRGPEPLAVAVEHFHCHHERSNIPGTQEDVMRLKAARWRWYSATPETRISADELVTLGRPAVAGLVFLNACSSQFVSPRAVSSFARELLLNGRNAVVTTWADVPDDVAFTIACFFYEALLRGDTVGASLREARIRLLLEKNNPLGLLFTVYGDSRFRLAGGTERARQGRVKR
jgi:hypothetical protein